MTTKLTPLQLDEAIGRARVAGTGNLWNSLAELTAASDRELNEALMAHHGVVTLQGRQLDAAQVLEVVRNGTISEASAVWLLVDGKAHLLCGDPWDPANLSRLGRRVGSVAALALPRQLASFTAPAPAQAPTKGTSAPASSGSSPVVAFVDAAIATARKDAASDIHFETDRQGVRIKYRIDGVMAPGTQLDDPSRAEEVISRIKVMAQLDITERRRPQDGRIHWESAGHEPLDLRVSIMPSTFGEDAVLRLLDKAHLRQAQQTISLNSLGFDEAIAAQIRGVAGRPHGMLLVTGPTGSGKTTTVYAALTEVNDGLEKIVTIEDPVEYELPGVLQIPVNEQKGLTFATGLRSILRHDPDKILVGEIRDAETAEIAVQSALTGHLVITTVHANSLFDVLGRFQHFGIDPFGLASALNGIVVQRLLRRACTHCVEWQPIDEQQSGMFAACGLAKPAQLPTASGCEHCRGTGYKGRLVVAEVHELDDSHRDLIVRRAPLLEMKEALYASGATGLLNKALAQAALGHTTLAEIRRVVGTV